MLHDRLDSHRSSVARYVECRKLLQHNLGEPVAKLKKFVPEHIEKMRKHVTAALSKVSETVKPEEWEGYITERSRCKEAKGDKTRHVHQETQAELITEDIGAGSAEEAEEAQEVEEDEEGAEEDEEAEEDIDEGQSPLEKVLEAADKRFASENNTPIKKPATTKHESHVLLKIVRRDG